MVGLLPLGAVTVIERWQRERVSKLAEHLSARLQRMPELVGSIHASGHRGVAERGILALVNEDRLRRILSTMLDEDEFLSPYGSARCRVITPTIHTCFRCTARNIWCIIFRRSRTPGCSAGTRTGADRSGCRSIFY